GEMPLRVGPRAKCNSGIAIGHKTRFVIARHGSDRADVWRTCRGTETVSRREACVDWLSPCVARIKRKIDTRCADARGKWARRWIAGITGLEIDIVVGAGNDDVGMCRIDRDRWLVLLVLREGRNRAADIHTCVGAKCR